ncbi:MAG TPA: winged helix-turn-helix domain-containing protein [Pyrinomonadaceae bacterium]
MSEQSGHFYEFGPFRIDPGKRVLLREGVPVPLTPKVFDTLLVLVQNSGNTVEKEELMRQLWPDSFVEEANLTENISKLRKALGEGPRENRYIATVPKGGYKFVASVREAKGAEAGEFVLQELSRARVTIEERVVDDEEAPRLISGHGAAEKKRIIEAALVRAGGKTPSGTVAARRPRWKSAPVLAAFVALAVLVAGFLLYRFVRRGNARPFEKVRLTRLTTTGKITNAVVSPDGKNFAYTVSEGGRESLWVRQVTAASTPVNIVAPLEDADYRGLTFSPGGDYVYFLRSVGPEPNTIYRVPVLGGAPISLLKDVDSAVAFSPDGKRVAFVRGYPSLRETALLVADSDGANEQKIVSLKSPADEFVLFAAPSWSPDGKLIAVASRHAGAGGEFQTLSAVEAASGGQVRPLTAQKWQAVGGASWLRDGSGLVFLAADFESTFAQQIWHVHYPEGAARQVTNDLNNYVGLSLAADSETILAVQSDRQSNIMVLPDADTKRAAQITSGNYDGANGLSWTPDGRIIYATRTGNDQNLWVTDADGSNQKQLTSNSGINRQPAVSPDGRYIAFVSNRSGRQHVWRIDADGSAPRPLTNGVNDTEPTFSPDARWVVYKSYTSGIPTLWRVPVSGGEPLRLTDRISAMPTVSPDGKLVACGYRPDPTGANRLALIPFDGGRPVKTLELPLFSTSRLHWVADGLTYTRLLKGVSNVWLQPVDGGAAKQVTDFKDGRIFWFGWSAEGKQLAVARGRLINDAVLVRNSR